MSDIPYKRSAETIEVTPEMVTEFIGGHLQPAEYLNKFKALPPMATIGIGYTALRVGTETFELDALERSVFHLLAINANRPTYPIIAAETIVGAEKKITPRKIGITATSLARKLNDATGQVVIRIQNNNAMLGRARRFGAVNFIQDVPFESNPQDEERRLWFGQQIRAVLERGLPKRA